MDRHVKTLEEIAAEFAEMLDNNNIGGAPSPEKGILGLEFINTYCKILQTIIKIKGGNKTTIMG